MDRESLIREMLNWQELYIQQMSIFSLYESDEQKLEALTLEVEQLQAKESSLQENLDVFSEKIESQSQKLDKLYSQIEQLEADRENLKMARQVKSWEKEMDNCLQDREVLEAQLYYDKAKMGDISKDFQEITDKIQDNLSKIKDLQSVLDAIKSEHADQMQSLDKQIAIASDKFDTGFAHYFERLLKKNRGYVLSAVEDDSCSICHIELPSSYLGGNEQQEAEDNSLKQCPNCFRYLYNIDTITSDH